MSDHRDLDRRSAGTVLEGDASAAGRPREVLSLSAKVEGLPRLRVCTIERTAIVRLESAAILFEESAVRAVGEQLHRLVEEGHTRLLVNFGGVRYLSSDMLAVLAGLQRQLEPARGRIQLCGLDPLVHQMLRISRLDGVFDV